MQLTEKERDLLVDTLIESLWQFPLEGTHRSVREMIVHKAIMPTIEGVLADRAVPEPDADAIERAAKAMWDFEGERLYGDNGKWDKAVEKGFTAVDYYRDMARTALQAAAVEPEPGLDELLDSVHPKTVIRRMYEMRKGGWEVSVSIPDGPDENGWYDYTGNEIIGTGPTRIDAIAAAVRQAKENGDG